MMLSKFKYCDHCAEETNILIGTQGEVICRNCHMLTIKYSHDRYRDEYHP